MDTEKIKNEIFAIAFEGLTDLEKDIIVYHNNNLRRRCGKRTVPRKLIKKIQRKMYRKNSHDLFNYLDKVLDIEIEDNLDKEIERMVSYEDIQTI